jgi:O-antigen/teichoic acid export membrane protein
MVAETEHELPPLPQPGREIGAKRPSFITNLATVLGTQAACAAMSLALEVVYARLLGPAGRGTISLSLMAISAGVVFGGVGGEIPITIWSADRKKNISEWIPAVLFWGMLGATAAGVVWAAIYWLGQPVFLKGITTPLAILVLVSIPANILYGYVLAIVTGRERFRGRAGILLANQATVFVIVLVFVGLFVRDPTMALIANLAGILTGTVIALFLLRTQIDRKWNVHSAKQSLGPAIRLGAWGQFGNLATFFNYRLDVFIVNYFLDPTQVGLYAVGVLVSESLWQVPQAAAVTLFPRTARTLEEENISFTCGVTRQVFALACLTGIVMALLCPWLVPMIFGARFSPSVPVIWWILPGTIAFASGKVMAADLAARGKPAYGSIFSFVTLAVTLLLDFALIPRMGIEGAALASSIAYLVDTLLVAAALKYELKVKWETLFFPSAADFAMYSRAWRKLLAFVAT